MRQLIVDFAAFERESGDQIRGPADDMFGAQGATS